MKNSILFGALCLMLAACGGNETKQDNDATTAPAATASVNSDAFNKGFSNLLTAYYDVRDGLVDWDTAKANQAAANLSILSDSLDVSHFANDSSKAVSETASSFSATITGSAKAMIKEADITAKRREFQMISNAVYDLARSVKYDQEKIFHIKCPMAFNDSEEAYWISSVPDVKNPYLGTKHPKYKNKMLECGEVTDSLGTINRAETR